MLCTLFDAVLTDAFRQVPSASFQDVSVTIAAHSMYTALEAPSTCPRVKKQLEDAEQRSLASSKSGS